LELVPSYLEAIRECTEQMLLKKERAQGEERIETAVQKNKFWNGCVDIIVTNGGDKLLKQNLKGQWQMRTDKLVEMLVGNEELVASASKEENG
jgi:ribosomal protein L17